MGALVVVLCQRAINTGDEWILLGMETRGTV